MKTAILKADKKYSEQSFQKEEDLERIVQTKSKLLFGQKTIYIEVKNRIDSKFLGATIPDGFLFDLTDEKNPEFYIVEIELSKHDFYRHIFPQITKFFAFFKNQNSISELIEKLYSLIDTDSNLKAQFVELIGERELYKKTKDIIENSQNILLVIDDMKPELGEVVETYTDTWDKYVRIEVLKKYAIEDDYLLTLTPDFVETSILELEEKSEVLDKYTVEFHTEYKDENIKELYDYIVSQMMRLDDKIIVNPQKYYISLKGAKNFAYIEVRKSKLIIVVVLPVVRGKEILKNIELSELSKSVQKYYNGECFKAILTSKDNVNEVITALTEAYNNQRK